MRIKMPARLALSAAAMMAVAASTAPWIAYGQERPVFKAAPAAASARAGLNRPCDRMAKATRTPHRITFHSSLVGDILAFAYDLPLDRIERRPQWMYDDCYDIEVSTGDPASLPEQKQMLQKLLEERFGLVTHRTSYPSPVYLLVRGPKVNLTETAEPNAPAIPELRPEPLRDSVYGAHVSMGDLAAWLYQRLQLPVVDKTGLTGWFDVQITGLPPRNTGDGIIQAVQDSLGLVLERHEGTAESLIIDHVEKPGDN